MARRERSRDRVNIKDENRRGIAFIAFVLWVIGFADLVLGVIHLPTPYAVWALVLAGLILLVTFVVELL